MKQSQSIFVFVIFSLWASLGLTAGPVSKIPLEADPPIRAHAMIEIQKFDSRSQTYSIVLTKEPAVGPNIATPEALARALGMTDARKLTADPSRIEGHVYQTNQQLELLSELGVRKRLQKLGRAPASAR